MQTRSTLCSAAILAIAVLFSASAYAQAPANEQIRFQGRLLDSTSNPITTTTSVEFNIYPGPTGGTSQWTETHNVTPSANGIFTVLFGTQTDFTGVDFGQPVYVGVTVDTDPEMTPRYLLSSSSVAHFAKDADTIDGLDSSSFAQVGSGTVTFTGDITANSFTGDGSGLTSLDASQLTGTVPMAALNATDLNTPNTLVLRNANGGFAAGGSTFNGGTGAGLTATTTGGVALDVQGSATIAGSLDTGGPITAAAPITTSGPLTVNTAPALINGGLIVSNVSASINAGLTVSGGPTALTVNGLSTFNAPITANAGLTSNAPITSNVAPITLGQQTNTSPVPLLFHDSNGTTTESGALLAPPTFTGSRSWTLPDASGNIALLSDLTGGTTAGNFTSLNVTGTGTFGGLLSANNGFNASATTTASPTAVFTGALLESFTNGTEGYGALGQVTYTGTAVGTGEQVIANFGIAHVSNTNAGIVAIGGGGQSVDQQFGDNIGAYGWAQQGGRNSGMMAVANATIAEQQTWAHPVTGSLGIAGFQSAAILGFNNGGTANDYGLYVEGANNRIVGNLNVTGTYTGNGSGLTSVTAAQLANGASVGAGGPQIRSGTADPSAGTGLTAPVGSLFLRDNAGAGELWLKTGAADTAWVLK